MMMMMRLKSKCEVMKSIDIKQSKNMNNQYLCAAIISSVYFSLGKIHT
jgi:hypothetical protein